MKLMHPDACEQRTQWPTRYAAANREEQAREEIRRIGTSARSRLDVSTGSVETPEQRDRYFNGLGYLTCKYYSRGSSVVPGTPSEVDYDAIVAQID
jgi:hypothetical protein